MRHFFFPELHKHAPSNGWENFVRATVISVTIKRSVVNISTTYCNINNFLGLPYIVSMRFEMFLRKTAVASLNSISQICL
jgi:hypothetical protein